jgi:hypothetical protein
MVELVEENFHWVQMQRETHERRGKQIGYWVGENFHWVQMQRETHERRG